MDWPASAMEAKPPAGAALRTVPLIRYPFPSRISISSTRISASEAFRPTAVGAGSDGRAESAVVSVAGRSALPFDVVQLPHGQVQPGSTRRIAATAKVPERAFINKYAHIPAENQGFEGVLFAQLRDKPYLIHL